MELIKVKATLADTSSLQENYRFVHVWNGQIAGKSSIDIILGILTHYGLLMEAGDIGFGHFGKPESQRTGNIRFNLSNDKELFALAVTNCGDIGVDLQEPIDSETKKDAMKAVFTAVELETMNQDSSRFPVSVYWAVKEALVKQEGSSIWFGNKLKIADKIAAYDGKHWISVENRWIYASLRGDRGFALALTGDQSPPPVPEFMNARLFLGHGA